jgi:RNA polymerase sigma-70 factor (ECF subfamily)
VQSDPAVPDASAATQREVVTAFLAASREGDFAGLLRLLDPHVVLRADSVAVAMAASRREYGAPELAPEVHGPEEVAKTFAGGARAARLILVDGLAGAVWSVGGRPQVVFGFTVRGRRVVGVELLADPETLDLLNLEPARG